MAVTRRQTSVRATSGELVLVSTVEHPMGRETAIFPLDEHYNVTSLMHLYKEQHGADEDLDAAHGRIVAAVMSGEIGAHDFADVTEDDVARAEAFFTLLRKAAETLGDSELDA